MYLFRIFRSFLPLRNPIGFGASDFVVLALAILLVGLLIGKSILEPYIRAISTRTRLCMCLLFGLAIVMRLALLPQSSVPIPSGADDFSYLLLGDTLAHLRFANKTHPLHEFFEAVFILQEPAYASIYPMGQGLFLAFGQVLAHSPWVGVLVSSGLFCALSYWMLRSWVPAVWALVGGLFTAIEFGPLSSWVNSYWGGYVSAIAGCLVFGALPRLRQSPRVRNGVLLGVGLGLQALTRPFEAVFLAIMASVYLAFGLRGKWEVTRKPLVACASILVTALGLTLMQNRAVSQSWSTMPYMMSRYEYGVPATLTFQPNATPHRKMTAEQELDYRAQSAVHGEGTDSVSEYFQRFADRCRYLRFFLLPPLYLAILMFVPSLKQSRYVWVLGTVLLFALGTNVYPYFYPHYIAAIACLFVLMSVIGLRRLKGWSREFVSLSCCAFFIFWYGLYLTGDNDLLSINAYQSWYYINRGDPQGRDSVEEKLRKAPGQQLVFVRYSASHRFAEWIHNDADIDSAPIVWANDLGQDENNKLLHYYPNRTAWLLEPDAHPIALTPYQAEAPAFQTVH